MFEVGTASQSANPLVRRQHRPSPHRPPLKQYIKVAEKHSMTPTELALAWCHSRPWVASTIIGAINKILRFDYHRSTTPNPTPNLSPCPSPPPTPTSTPISAPTLIPTPTSTPPPNSDRRCDHPRPAQGEHRKFQARVHERDERRRQRSLPPVPRPFEDQLKDDS